MFRGDDTKAMLEIVIHAVNDVRYPSVKNYEPHQLK